MDYGTLRLVLPGGQALDFAFDSPSVSIGRDPANRLVLDHPSVDRRHARLTIESGNLVVEDLGSAQGTFVGGVRIAPRTPNLVVAGQALDFGQVRAVFVPGAALRPAGAPGPAAMAATAPAAGTLPPAAATPGRTAPAAPSTGGRTALAISVVPPGAPVPPGTATTATATVQNRGTVVDDVHIRVEGVPADWVRLSRERLSLLPGVREDVTVTLQPSRGAGALAGEYPFTVVAASSQQGAEARADARLVVLPFAGLEFEIRPVRSSGTFHLRAANVGNAATSLAFRASDPEDALTFVLAAPQVALPPGEERSIALRVRPKKRKYFGPELVRSFQVEARPTAPPGAPRATADGQLVTKPPLEAWRRPAMLALLLGVLVGGGIGYTRVCEGNWPACPGGDGGVPLGPPPVQAVLPAVVTPAQSPVAGGPSPSPTAPGGTPTKPQPSAAASVPPAASPSPSAQASPTPTTPTPAVATAVPVTSPSVLWMVATHSGTAVMTLRLGTDVPTKATVSVFRPATRGTPPPTPPPSSGDGFDKEHTISIPTYGETAGFTVEVQDEKGRVARASLEIAPPITTYWMGTGDEPSLALKSGRQAAVAWTIVRPTGATTAFPAEVMLFSKGTACRTANACLPEPAASFAVKTAPLGRTADAYSATVAFPDNTHDYEVVAVTRGVIASGTEKGAAIAQFYQFPGVAGKSLK